jgi:xanthine dehydrogenase accessory factor
MAREPDVVPRRPVVVVLGCDETGSAVAHRLHLDGYAVVLIDRIDPPWARRGMALTDAWYEGTAQLAGVSAVFCASVRSIPAVLSRAGAIAATAWSWAGVASALSPIAIVETRAPSARRTPLDRKAVPPLLTIEVMPGALVGPEFDLAVAMPPRQSPGTRTLFASCTGFFATSRAIGDAVHRGDTLGGIAGVAVIAPLDGRVRALSARGARVHAGCELAEIDPRGDFASCFGLDPRAEAIARATSQLIGRERPLRRALPAPVMAATQRA